MSDPDQVRAERILREPWRSKRRYALLGIGLLGLAAGIALDLSWRGLLPRGSGWALWNRFFGAALQPAITYESDLRLPGSPPFLWAIATSLWITVRFALASMALALVGGLVLGVLSSHSFWGLTPLQKGGLQRGGAWGSSWRSMMRLGFRGIAILLRSVHELMWAILLLAAIGLNDTAGLLALTIPFTGILAKIFAELLDEAPSGPSLALAGLGSTRAVSILAGRLPMAWPDMAAYGFYRFECAVRSSAVLGFFGFQTLGYHLELSYASLHYREVWTQLYAMLLLVWLLERWSSALRRRALA